MYSVYCGTAAAAYHCTVYSCSRLAGCAHVPTCRYLATSRYSVFECLLVVQLYCSSRYLSAAIPPPPLIRMGSASY